MSRRSKIDRGSRGACALRFCNNAYYKTKNSVGNDISYYKFPKDDAVRKIWLKKCSLKDPLSNGENKYICSEHFIQEDFERNYWEELMGIRKKRKLKPDAVPSLKLGPVLTLVLPEISKMISNKKNIQLACPKRKCIVLNKDIDAKRPRKIPLILRRNIKQENPSTSTNPAVSANLSPIVLIEPLDYAEGMKYSDIVASHNEKSRKDKGPINKSPDGKSSVRISSVGKKTSPVCRKLFKKVDDPKDPQAQTPPKMISQPVDKIVTSTPKPMSNFQKMFLIMDKSPTENTPLKVATSPKQIAFVPCAFQPFNTSAALESEKNETVMMTDTTNAACPVQGAKKPMYYLITSSSQSSLSKEITGTPVETSVNNSANEQTLFELNCQRKEWTEKTVDEDITDSTSKFILSSESVIPKSNIKSDNSNKMIKIGDTSFENFEEKCAVLNCPTNLSCDVKLFEFPPAEQVVRYVRWLQFTKNPKIKRKIKDKAKYYICARHFDDSQFSSDDKNEIAGNALPTKNPPNLSEISSNSSTKMVSAIPANEDSGLSLKITSVESLAKNVSVAENERNVIKDSNIIKSMPLADDVNSDLNNDEMVLDCGSNLDKSLNAVHEVWDPKDAWNRYKEKIEAMKCYGKYKEPIFNSLVKLNKNHVRKKRKYAIVLKNIDGVMEIDKLKKLVLQKIDYVYGLINEDLKSSSSVKVDDNLNVVNENSELAEITKEIGDLSDNSALKTSCTNDTLNNSSNLDHDYACSSVTNQVEDIYRDLVNDDDDEDNDHSSIKVNDFSCNVVNEVTVISNEVSNVMTDNSGDMVETHIDNELFEVDSVGTAVELNDKVDDKDCESRINLNDKSSNNTSVTKKNEMSVFDLNTGNEISVMDLMDTVAKVVSSEAVKSSASVEKSDEASIEKSDSGNKVTSKGDTLKVFVNDGKFAGKTGRVQLVLKPVNEKLKTKKVIKLRPVKPEPPVKKEVVAKAEENGEYRMNDRVPGVLSKYRIRYRAMPISDNKPLLSLVTDIDSLIQTTKPNKSHGSSLCDFCGQVIKDGMTLKSHINDCHVEKTCGICGEVFPSRKEYKRHFRKEHKAKKPKKIKRPFVIRNGKRYSACPICEKGFFEYGSLKKHKLVVHNIGKYHVCDVCGQKCVDRHLLLLHKATHNKQRAIVGVCPDCGRSFLSRSAMNSHIRVQHRKNTLHPCPVCGKMFVTPYKLRTHIARHTNGLNKEFDEAAKKILNNELKQKEYRCVICNCILETSDLLKQHMEYHKDDESIPAFSTGDDKGTLPCRICNERFAKEKRLAAHVFYIHNEMPPFMCRDSDCDSKYWTAKELDLHCLSIHVKRLFTCKICLENFSSYHEKLKHMKNIHQQVTKSAGGPVECPICFKEIRSKNAMGLHMVVHNDTKDLLCGICNKNFHSPGGLASHLRVKHGIMRNKKARNKMSNLKSVTLTMSDVDNIINGDNKPPLEAIDDIINNAVESDIIIDDNYSDKEICFDLYQNDDEKFKCPDCNELFGSEDLLNEHILITHNEILFEQEI